MTSRPVMAPIAALALSVALGSAPFAQSREFAHVRELGGALVEYNDGATQAVAAYGQSPRGGSSRGPKRAAPRSTARRRSHCDRGPSAPARG